jgi:phosphoribosylaminoimidazole-succinocarboxamide synthase
MTEYRYEGKVRNVWKLDNSLILEATDRISCFDRHVGIIPRKGELLTKMSKFWFDRTKDIIDNHVLMTYNNLMVVKKCVPFKIEFVVRAYITGNTATSLWTHYKKGAREYCGITFPEGLKEHEKLEKPVITPTTKGEVDVPISKEEIINQEYMTSEEWDFVSQKTIKLFERGQEIADQAGFILVDTKYEFGKTEDGKMILIDEIHTCDSSRYWIKDTYETCMLENRNPDKLDKDCARDWIKSVCDPYKEPIPEIPEEIIKRIQNSYQYFYDKLDEVNDGDKSLVVILAGSQSDDIHIKKIENELNTQNIRSVSHVASAHRNTREVLELIEKYDKYNKLIWVTVAGKSNALSGVVAANSIKPVIACPPFADKVDQQININSTLQCPAMVPVMTILDPKNVALAISKILNL